MIFIPGLLFEVVLGVGVPLAMIGAAAGGWTYAMGATAPGQAVVTAVAGAGAATKVAGASTAMVGHAVRIIPSLTGIL